MRVGKDKRELLRKINGRRWTQDNRLVSPPKSSGMIGFWQVDSKVGVCEFYHHRPFDLRRAELLHLWMTPADVESLLGQPNRRFPMGSEQGGMWYYFSADGTALQLWFIGPGELGQAKYLLPGGGERPVAAIEQELNGQSMFKVSAQRASQRLKQNAADRRPGPRGMPGESIPIPRAEEPSRPVRKSIVSKPALDSIQPGLTRDELLAQLGEPSYMSSISGDEGMRETFTYHLDETATVAIKLLNGKVVQVR